MTIPWNLILTIFYFFSLQQKEAGPGLQRKPERNRKSRCTTVLKCKRVRTLPPKVCSDALPLRRSERGNVMEGRCGSCSGIQGERATYFLPLPRDFQDDAHLVFNTLTCDLTSTLVSVPSLDYLPTVPL